MLIVLIPGGKERKRESERGGERERENLKGLVLEDSQKNLGTYNLYWEGNSMDGTRQSE